MELVSVGKFRLRSDPVLTRRAHEGCSSSTDKCGCVECRNFAAARDQAYPAEALALFEQLGIDPTCEAEVDYVGPKKRGLHRYSTQFYFVGVIEEKEPDSFAMMLDDFALWFYPGPASLPGTFDGLTTVEVHVETVVPWVIDLPEPFIDVL